MEKNIEMPFKIGEMFRIAGHVFEVKKFLGRGRVVFKMVGRWAETSERSFVQ